MKKKKAEPITVRCPVCDSRKGKQAFKKKEFAHYICKDCGALYIFPMPTREELREFYNSRNSKDVTSSVCWKDDRQQFLPQWSRALKIANSEAEKGHLLDIGCGAGQFLALAREKGWKEIYGIELSTLAAEQAKKIPGAKIFTNDFQGIDFDSTKFALITMWDVYEHFNNPRGAIKKAREILKPGGILIISTVNRRGLTFRIFKQNSTIVIPPEHLVYSTRKNIRRVFESEGFQVMKIHCIDLYIRDWINLLSKSSDDREKPKEKAESATEYKHPGWASKIISTGLFQMLRKVVNILLNLTGLGDQIILIARRAEGINTTNRY